MQKTDNGHACVEISDGRSADVQHFLYVPRSTTCPCQIYVRYCGRFDRVHDESTTQESLFNEEVSSLLPACYTGQNVTVLAYGVTGSGKVSLTFPTPARPCVILLSSISKTVWFAVWVGVIAAFGLF